jgi:hypothetical protein
MPKYRATLAYNCRAYRVKEFEAPDDDSARTTAKSIQDWPAQADLVWPELDIYSNDFDEIEASDRIIMLDKGDSFPLEVVEDEITIEKEKPYSWDAIQLIRDIVAQSESDEPVSGADFMQTMFDRARAIVGKG